MPFSYDRAWQDVMAMFRSDWALLVTLAGVFIFFPALVLFLYAPMPEAPPESSAETSVQLIYAYYQANMLWVVLMNAIGVFGQAAILALLLDRARPTVGEALAGAGALFPGFFVVQLLTNFATGAALMLLVVPGLYLLGRFEVVGPLLIERRMANPLRAISDGWRMTEKRGWRITGLVLLVIIVGWIVTSAATSALTVLGTMVVPESVRPLVRGFIGGLSSAALALLMAVLSAAIYRQLVAGDWIAEVFD